MTGLVVLSRTFSMASTMASAAWAGHSAGITPEGSDDGRGSRGARVAGVGAAMGRNPTRPPGWRTQPGQRWKIDTGSQATVPTAATVVALASVTDVLVGEVLVAGDV